jgi:uncharacterized protein (DUF433 family)
MAEEIAEGKSKRKLTKTRQLYGFIGETNYDEEFIRELEMDFEESGEHCSLRRLKGGTNNIAILEGRIVIDPDIAHGRLVIKGTRVPVEIILGSLAGGMEINDVAVEYGLEREDVLAALGYAAKIMVGMRLNV